MVKFQTELFAQKKELDTAEVPVAPSIVVASHDNHYVVTSPADEWSFASSFLYSLTLITTVGEQKKTTFFYNTGGSSHSTVKRE